MFSFKRCSEQPQPKRPPASQKSGSKQGYRHRLWLVRRFSKTNQRPLGFKTSASTWNSAEIQKKVPDTQEVVLREPPADLWWSSSNLPWVSHFDQTVANTSTSTGPLMPNTGSWMLEGQILWSWEPELKSIVVWAREFKCELMFLRLGAFIVLSANWSSSEFWRLLKIHTWVLESLDFFFLEVQT